MSTLKDQEFSRERAQQMLEEQEVKLFIVDQVQSSLKEKETDTDRHHRDKKVYEQVKEQVKRMTDELR